MEDESKRAEPDTGANVSDTGERVVSRDILELDHVYGSLGHSRRRYLCYTLHTDTEWSLTDLARKIAAWEYEIPEHEVTEAQQTELYVSLYHSHVPKLVDEGVIVFDQMSETITAAGNAEQVLSALEGMGASLDSKQEAHAQGEMDERKE